MRTALALSLNTATVRLLERVGVSNVIDLAKSLHINSNFEKNLSLALGSTEVIPIELANAYATAARAGIYIPPYARDKAGKDSQIELSLTQKILTDAPWFAHGIADRRVVVPKIKSRRRVPLVVFVAVHERLQKIKPVAQPLRVAAVERREKRRVLREAGLVHVGRVGVLRVVQHFPRARRAREDNRNPAVHAAVVQIIQHAALLVTQRLLCLFEV